MQTARSRHLAHTYADGPSPTPSPGWVVVLASPCQRHKRPAGEPCWTGAIVGCCGSRVDVMRTRP